MIAGYESLRNLAAEALQRLLADQIRVRMTRNLVEAKYPADASATDTFGVKRALESLPGLEPCPTPDTASSDGVPC